MWRSSLFTFTRRAMDSLHCVVNDQAMMAANLVRSKGLCKNVDSQSRDKRDGNNDWKESLRYASSGHS